ncbi:MAG TPA: TlpA disulfide reductase family protein [Sideroxyarcus sp.]|nr:TlpA disulfide reductase family protein [Sideroxyarcus sp.]
MLIKNLLGALLVLAALPASVYAGTGTGPEIGKPSPNLIGRTLDDKSYRLKGDQGAPKVINFFWVGCKPCRLEMPELAKLEKQYAGIKFISVHTQDELPESVEKFVKSLSGAPSTIVLTSGGVQETFNYMGLPHTIVLDSNNVVLLSLSGYTPDNMKLLNTTLKKLAKQ